MPRVLRAARFTPLASHNNRIQPSPAPQHSNFHTSAFAKIGQIANGSVANGAAGIISKPNGFTISPDAALLLSNSNANRTFNPSITPPAITRSPTPIHRRKATSTITPTVPIGSRTHQQQQQHLQPSKSPAPAPSATTTTTSFVSTATEATSSADVAHVSNPPASPTIPNGLTTKSPRGSPQFVRSEGALPRPDGVTPRQPTTTPLPAGVLGSVDDDYDDDNDNGSKRNERRWSGVSRGSTTLAVTAVRGPSNDAQRRPSVALIEGLADTIRGATSVGRTGIGVGTGPEPGAAANPAPSGGVAGGASSSETAEGDRRTARAAEANTVKTTSGSEKSNGTLLSVGALSVVTTAPRRVGPIFPDTLDAVRTKADSLVIGVPGLEYLTSIDQLNVRNRTLLLKSIVGCEMVHGGFAIKNLLGQTVFGVEEDTACFASTCLCAPPKHPLNLTVRDSHRRKVLRLSRPDRCVCCCFPCCLQVVTVSSPPWGELGSVHHEWSLSSPQLAIKNSEGKTQFRIVGPVCTCSECQQGDLITFPVTSTETGQQVGRISRPFRQPTPAAGRVSQREPIVRHLVEDPAKMGDPSQLTYSADGATSEPGAFNDGYSVSFNKELPVPMKAVLLSAVLLIDFLYSDLRKAKVKST